MLTGIVIVKNAQEQIGKCLGTLGVCQQIIVVDDYSLDKTVEKISRLKDSRIKVYQHRSEGDLAGQRNFGLEMAKNGWVLFVDADEEVPSDLSEEIVSLIREKEQTSDLVNGYLLRRSDFFLNRWLRHGETGCVKLLRLAKKGTGEWKRPVHEYWDVKGKIGELKNPLLHFSHPNIRSLVSKINQWSEIDALALSKEKKQFMYPQVILNPLGKFVVNYFFRLGLLDGFPGFVMAFMMSFYSLVVRVKQYGLSQTS